MHEQEAKEKAREKKGELLDSFSLVIGTAGKGGALAIKCYVDMLDVSKEGEPDTDTEKKLTNLKKLRQKALQEGLVGQER